MPSITSARILIIATHGYERSELRVPLEQLTAKGATVRIASLEKAPIKSWDEKNWGDTVDVDLTLEEVKIDDFDALVLPGGQINPDLLRKEQKAVDLVKTFLHSGKTVAAICHGPWLLVESGLAKGRAVTSWPSLKTDLGNAGAEWTDAEVVVDGGLITSRKPGDIPAFADAVAKALAG